MISSELQRTLVKSPPELWAELSDPAALARHLGELGEIRIVRTEPEKTVEWAAENTTGTVSIQPSGWGTNVKLTVTREIVETPPVPESQPQLDRVIEVQPAAAAEPEPTAPPEPVAAPTPEPTMALEPEIGLRSRRGFFARVFGRHRREKMVQHEPSGPSLSADAFAAVRQALAQETFAAVNPFAANPVATHLTDTPATEAADGPGTTDMERETQAEQVDDISAELIAVEEVAAEEVSAVLAAMLDRLGAAHHRPFSRA